VTIVYRIKQKVNLEMLVFLMLGLAVSRKRDGPKVADDPVVEPTPQFTQAFELSWGKYIIIQISLFLFYMANPRGDE
jgi:hypothetical protein